MHIDPILPLVVGLIFIILMMGLFFIGGVVTVVLPPLCRQLNGWMLNV